MTRNCSACNIKIDINHYKKDRTVCKSCYNKNKIKTKNKKITVLTNSQKVKTLIITITKTEQLLLDFQIATKFI